ncbi:MAG TPA: hypothetical protein VMW56_15375 [Candidatus Margulisiibacteriota bacterium]|nr:hypothetical protein [Candidatus Margulisiibacteriota bacterium]
MQKWLMMAVLLALPTVGAAVRAEDAKDVIPIKSSEGQTLAVLVQCNNCAKATAGAKNCRTGVEEGYLNGRACGKCMITENYGARLAYAYDLHLVGKLVDAQGQPIKDRFVKVFMANGWNIRTRTSDAGTYRLMLGATVERKSTTPVVVDLGTRVDSPKDNKEFYAMFLLPDGYKPCPAAKPEPKKHKPAKP